MKKRFPVFLLLFLFSIVMLSPPLPRVSAQAATGAQPGAQTLRAAGLREVVTVRRDERGIPYIEAANEADLYFAQGYVTASDRLWQMDLLRRTARGELSELFGKATLEEDKRHRTYGFGRMSDALVAQLPAQIRTALDDYTRGVNAYIESLDQKSLPPEFQLLQYRPRPWTPADSMALGKNFSEALSTTWFTDVLRGTAAALPKDKLEMLLPVTSPLDVIVVGTDATDRKPPRSSALESIPTFRARTSSTLQALARIETEVRRSLERIGLDAEERAASNNWVVSGKRTATGKPLLANDPHLSPGAPSIWYMMHLSAPGLRVAGVTSPGAPGIIIGHNERIAWGLTNLGPDVQDVYIEKFDPANPRRYMTPAGWRDAEVRREEIKVRKDPTKTDMDVVVHEVVSTRHGPIVFEQGGNRYALRWTALEGQANEFEGFHHLNRARDWKDFQKALSRYTGPTQNFIYADIDGHIGYYGAGRVPIRKSGDGTVPYDGSTDAGEWTGYIPFEGLPHVFDPPSGIIVTANNRVVGKSYPYYLTDHWASPLRARRIYDLLSAKPKLTIEDFRRVMADTHSISGQIFAREVLKLAREGNFGATDPTWNETVKLLEAWDGSVEPDSRAALLVNAMRVPFRLKIVGGAIGAELAPRYSWGNQATFLDRVIVERPREWLPKEFKDYGEFIRALHTEARATLTQRYGADPSQWTWGRLALVNFPHLLAGVPVVGQQFAIQPFPQRGSGNNLVTVNVGAAVSMRLIADPSNWDRTQQGIAPGESGNPASPHWRDQIDDWRNVTPRTFPFTAPAVAAATRQTLRLTPASK
ncbi:MAG TPA: penicillin acylase family protein [Pyrinomonadaceae bacterium]|jgi:penicillin amidase